MCVLVWFVLCSFLSPVHGAKDETFAQTIRNEIKELKTRQNLCDARVTELEAVVKELKEHNGKLEVRLWMVLENFKQCENLIFLF